MKKLQTLIFFFISLAVSAQNWTADMQKDFRKSQDVAVVVDLTQATICDLSYDKFPIYYAGKEKCDKEYAEVLLEQVQNMFLNGILEALKLPRVDKDKAKYVIHYIFYNITEDAAFSGRFYVMCGDNKSAEMPFWQPKGRWNTFEKLLKENVKDYVQNVNKGNSKSPFRCNLYSYK